jgi:hypothetical protein
LRYFNSVISQGFNYSCFLEIHVWITFCREETNVDLINYVLEQCNEIFLKKKVEYNLQILEVPAWIEMVWVNCTFEWDCKCSNYLQLWNFPLFYRLSFPSGHSSFSAYTMIYLVVSITSSDDMVWVGLHFPVIITISLNKEWFPHEGFVNLSQDHIKQTRNPEWHLDPAQWGSIYFPCVVISVLISLK